MDTEDPVDNLMDQLLGGADAGGENIEELWEEGVEGSGTGVGRLTHTGEGSYDLRKL